LRSSATDVQAGLPAAEMNGAAARLGQLWAAGAFLLVLAMVVRLVDIGSWQDSTRALGSCTGRVEWRNRRSLPKEISAAAMSAAPFARCAASPQLNSSMNGRGRQRASSASGQEISSGNRPVCSAQASIV
jgi:hypothetical protein